MDGNDPEPVIIDFLWQSLQPRQGTIAVDSVKGPDKEQEDRTLKVFQSEWWPIQPACLLRLGKWGYARPWCYRLLAHGVEIEEHPDPQNHCDAKKNE